MFSKIIDRYKNFKKNSLEKRINSYQQLIRKNNVHKVERKAAIDFFCDFPQHPDKCTQALLKRFDFSDDNSIIDSREKQACLEGIISKGDQAIEVLKEHILNSFYIAWPFKALSALEDSIKVIEILNQALSPDGDQFDQKNTEKNYDILCHLLDFDQKFDFLKVSKFLNHHDEKLRLCAVEILVKHDDHPYEKRLENFIYDQSTENRRIHHVVINAYIENNWKLKDKDRYKNTRINGYDITEDGTIVKQTA